jgi:hypothetical protein
MNPPLTLAEFEALPLVRDPFFRYGLELSSHTSATIIPETQRVTIRIASPPDVILSAQKRCPGALGEPQALRVRSRAGRHGIEVDAPRSGDCVLRIFAARASERAPTEIVYHWALDYRIAAPPTASR